MFERIEVKVGQVYEETDRHKEKWRVEAYVRVPGIGPHVRLCSLTDRSMKRTLSAAAVGDTRRFHQIAVEAARATELVSEAGLEKAKAAA